MAETWQEGVMLLHARGWNGELIDEACTALLEACSEGELEGKDVRELESNEAQRVLAEPVDDDEIRALCRLASIHDRGDATGDEFRAALRDLDAFADSLGEG
jgi:hypothetical protein